MKFYCGKCGYNFLYKDKLKNYLLPFKYIRCKCGRLYRISQNSLTISSLITYLPLLIYLYSIDEISAYSYKSLLIFLLWAIIVWLFTPFFATFKEVDK